MMVINHGITETQFVYINDPIFMAGLREVIPLEFKFLKNDDAAADSCRCVL